MTHECQEIVDGLMDAVEQLYCISFAQRTVLTAIYGEGWEPSAAYVQAEIAPNVAQLFEPLRDAISEDLDGNYPPAGWRQVVRRLVDSATPPLDEF
jgi:hypothetical protein